MPNWEEIARALKNLEAIQTPSDRDQLRAELTRAGRLFLRNRRCDDASSCESLWYRSLLVEGERHRISHGLPGHLLPVVGAEECQDDESTDEQATEQIAQSADTAPPARRVNNTDATNVFVATALRSLPLPRFLIELSYLQTSRERRPDEARPDQSILDPQLAEAFFVRHVFMELSVLRSAYLDPAAFPSWEVTFVQPGPPALLLVSDWQPRLSEHTLLTLVRSATDLCEQLAQDEGAVSTMTIQDNDGEHTATIPTDPDWARAVEAREDQASLVTPDLELTAGEEPVHEVDPRPSAEAPIVHPLQGLIEIDVRCGNAATRAIQALFDSPDLEISAEKLEELEISNANMPNDRVRYVRNAIAKKYPEIRPFVKTRMQGAPAADRPAVVFLIDDRDSGLG